MTFREGDVRSLPFGDNYFDVVVSGVFMHTVGKECGKRTVEAAVDRTRGRCGNNFFYFSIVDFKKKFIFFICFFQLIFQSFLFDVEFSFLFIKMHTWIFFNI